MNQYDFFRTFTKGLKFDKSELKKTYSKKDVEQQFIDNGEEGNCYSETPLEGEFKQPKKKLSHEKMIQFKQEQVNRIRNKNHIHVWGSDVPTPFTDFDMFEKELKHTNTIVQNLRNEGFTAPTPIQMQVWPLMLNDRNILACAPTGSGKTAGFLIPMIEHLKGPRKKGFRAVIVSPTRELAKQTYRVCCRLCEGLGLRTYMINKVSKAKEKFGPNSAKKYDILITTPNRLVYMLTETEEATMDLSQVKWLIVDESDRLFEGGIKGFRDQMATIYQACTNPEVRRAFFSATFAYDLEQWCKLNLDNIAMVNIGARNSACSDVTQELLCCGMEDGKLLGLKNIFKGGFEPPVLIFVQTKERAKDLFLKILWDTNIDMVDYISSDRTQLERDNSVKAFREGKLWVLICTELLARGIDFVGVNLVINYDFPPSTVSYIHRIGRTGRANQKGKAITFWTEEDRENLRIIATIMKNSGSDIPDWMLQGKKKKKNKIEKQPKRGNIAPELKHYKYLKRQQKKAKTRLKQMKNKNNKNTSSGAKTQPIKRKAPAKETSESKKRKRE